MEFPGFDEDRTHGIASAPLIGLALSGGLVIACILWWLI